MLTVDAAWSVGGLPRIESALLLSHATGWSRTTLIAHGGMVLPDPAEARFRALVERRVAGEPIAYLLGVREFYGIELLVNRSVLIPRPETELLVDLALAAHAHGARRFLDLATGSGAVAVAIAKNAPGAEVWATDVAHEALAIARRNADRNRLRIRFAAGSWFEPVGTEQFDVITANPPYVADADPHLTAGDLRFEPRIALRGGIDGLAAIRAIGADALRHLHPGGWLYIEHGYDQSAPVRRLLEVAGLESVQSWPDLQGHARVSGGTRLTDRP